MPDNLRSKRGYEPSAAFDAVMRGKPAPTEIKPAEDQALLPTLNDPYKAASSLVDSEVSRLVLVMGKDGFRVGGNAYIALPYMHMGIGQFGFTEHGQVFSFVFADLQPKLVTMYGRNVLRYFDHISQGRMPWIREADRDFRPNPLTPDSLPIFTRFHVENWKREMDQAEKLAEALAVHQA